MHLDQTPSAECDFAPHPPLFFNRLPGSEGNHLRGFGF
jgi:hypothetical protein